MKRIMLVVVVGLLMAACSTRSEKPTHTLVSAESFGDYEACFLLQTIDGKTVAAHESTLCDEPLPPCSTFKIPNSLVALESRAVAVNEVLPYDGSPQHFNSWERDHTMATALRYSVVWYYQEVARRVGDTEMQSFLERVHYGNEDISAGIDSFWLDSSLQITPREQLDFVSRFYRFELPVAKATVAEVQDMLVLDETDTELFAGKTGTCLDPRVGWFVGYAQAGDTELVFVTLIRGDDARGAIARGLTQRALTDLGYLPTHGR